MTAEHTVEQPQRVSFQDAGLARRLVRSSRVGPTDAEDITQEVLCALAFRRSPIDVPDGLTTEQARGAFLRGVVERQVARHLRRSAHLRRGDTLWSGLAARDAAPSAEELSIDLAPRRSLRRAIEHLRQLDPDLYEVAEHVACGRPLMTLVAELKLPEGTVRSRLRRARAALRGLIEQDTGARGALTHGASR